MTKKLKAAFFGDILSGLSTFIVSTLILTALFAPYLCEFLNIDPTKQNLFSRLAAPDNVFLLGTDSLGRDVLARLIMGARVSLSVACAAALCSALFGCFIGLVSGFYGGVLDKILMRFTDAILALPLLPLLIIISAIDFGALGLSETTVNAPAFSLYKMIVIIALFAWPAAARLVRAGALSAKQQLYVLSSRALGVGEIAIMLRHILPNVIAPLIVATSLAVGNIIILESSLSFLGLGISKPTSSWGSMLQGAEDFIWEAPFLAVWPGLAIFITVIAFNILGDSLREAYNPKTNK